MGLARNLSKFKPSSDGLADIADINATGTPSSSTFLRGDGAWAELSTLGGADVTSSATDVTLTSSSKRVQSIAITVADKYVILPDATTMTVGSPVFVIRNDGDRLFGIKTSDGKIVNEGLAKGSSVTLTLDSTSDSYAGWGYVFHYQTKVAMPASIWTTHHESYQIAKLDSSNILLCYVDKTNQDVYAVIGTISGNTLTWGTPQAVAAGVTAYICFCEALSSTTALVGWADGSSNSRYYGLTISGTSITVSTVSATQTGDQVSSIIKRNSTTAMLLDWNTGVFKARIITHNGTSAPTFGSAANIVSNLWGYVDLGYRPCNGVLLDTDKFVVTAYDPATGGTTTRVATVSGTTITYGTAYTATSIGHRVTLMKVDASTIITTGGYSIAISGTSISSVSSRLFNDYDGGFANSGGIYYGSNNLIIGDLNYSYLHIGKYYSSSDAFISSSGAIGYSVHQVIQLDTSKFLAVGKSYTRIVEVV